MTVLNILSGGAAQGLVASLAPTFKDQTGLDIEGEFGAVGAMAGKLREGTPADLVVLTAALIADLAKEKLVTDASVSDIGRVETAIAVRDGELFLEDKLRSILALDYPRELMEILVLSDGSADRTGSPDQNRLSHGSSPSESAVQRSASCAVSRKLQMTKPDMTPDAIR